MIRWIILLLLLVVPASAQVGYVPIYVLPGGAAHPNIGIDSVVSLGPNQGASGTSASLNMTTSDSNDVIMVMSHSTAGYPTSVTATGLTFTLYAENTAGSTYGAIYYAVATSPISNLPITVNYAASNFITLEMFSVFGANTSSPFNGTIGWASGSLSADPSVTTTVGSSLVIGWFNQTNLQNGTAGLGWTLLDQAWYATLMYSFKTSTGTYTPTEGTADTALAAAFALTPASGGGGCTTSLNFSQACNSQYIALVMP